MARDRVAQQQNRGVREDEESVEGQEDRAARVLSGWRSTEYHINIRLLVNASGSYWRYVSQ